MTGFRKNSHTLAISLCLWLLGGCFTASADTPAAGAEQRAEAVTQVVLGILSYARWPVEPQQLRLCVIGPTQYTDDLLKGTTQASGRAVKVRRLLVDDLRIVSECDGVYIGELEPAERSRLFASITGKPILSISENDAQCSVGSLFCLNVADEQVSFQVNLDSVARSGVRIHPSVLQLSKRRSAQP
ncbi:MAG: YfiR family protein [Pseudomonas sp.]|uniref:YfiR family protein n=1 Tax=Pseudomonas abieticivorans TaxID=2931382 RepID=UPI0020C172EE|nr:YfiR family protein [Pseudomonas sp. PIA16]MDE1169200.1 YfiR family protein [Pseudomonas sp.]